MRAPLLSPANFRIANMFPKDVTADGLTQGNRTQGLGRGCDRCKVPLQASHQVFGHALVYFHQNAAKPALVRFESGGAGPPVRRSGVGRPEWIPSNVRPNRDWSQSSRWLGRQRRITVRFLSLDKQVRCRPDFGTKVRLWNGSTPSGLDL